MLKVFLLLSLVSLTSCKTILIKMFLKNPRVETTETIKNFQLENNFKTENSLILHADTSSALEKLALGLTIGYYIFDKDGNQICYNGSETCRGSQFKQLINGDLDSFRLCNNDVHLKTILQQTYNLQDEPVDIVDFPASDYYVVSYWQKFFGGKRGYVDAVAWMEEEIEKNPTKTSFTFIKINTDLQERWGFVAGKKAKLKWEREGDYMTLQVTELPLK